MPPPAPVTAVTCHFDPICPWTWLTTRWLVGEADRRGVPVRWRAFSLLLANEGEPGDDLPPPAELSTRFLRIVEALAAAGDDDLVGELYHRVGTTLHVDGRDASPGLLAEALDAVDRADLLAVADDPEATAAVRAATEEAVALVGEDVGSPVLVWGDPPVGVFGPVVDPEPTGVDAQHLWDHVFDLAAVPQFSELKRSRADSPRTAAP